MHTSRITFHSPIKTTAPYGQPQRIASIDILRALTMVLMIFVNDLWSLKNIPSWLGHVDADKDGMGLADIVFPAFLFIVGMSIPFAVMNRRKKGERKVDIIKHILLRSIALLIMGLFLVNGEYINAEATGMHRLVWNVLSCTAFILIWNSYPTSTSKWWIRGLKAIGVSVLIILFFLYRSGEPEKFHGFSTHWWGILGLIGWSYLVSGILFTLFEKLFLAIIASWILLHALCMAAHADLITNKFLNVVLSPINHGALPALTMGGVVISMIYLRFRKQNREATMMLVIAMIAVTMITLGIFTGTYWNISKIRATPPWILLCGGITILVFLLIYWLADRLQKAHWFNFIKPAGTNTLLCYFVPHFAYAIVVASSVHYPAFILTGPVGLVKSLLFALLVVWLAGYLETKHVRLKL